MSTRDRSGTIVILNGTSSSGKSTIAKELQRASDTPTLHLSLDLFTQMVPDGFFVASDGVDPPTVDGVLWIMSDDGRRVSEMRVGPLGVRLKESMYRAARAMASTGFDVVVDDVTIDPRVFDVMARVLAGHAYLVGVRCSKDEALRRERHR
ncbi:MAG: AAA family ATPase, partial [Halobacteriales archaeon]|nr:AAA family ATPase [Halobacteriales archaeon]